MFYSRENRDLKLGRLQCCNWINEYNITVLCHLSYLLIANNAYAQMSSFVMQAMQFIAVISWIINARQRANTILHEDLECDDESKLCLIMPLCKSSTFLMKYGNLHANLSLSILDCYAFMECHAHLYLGYTSKDLCLKNHVLIVSFYFDSIIFIWMINKNTHRNTSNVQFIKKNYNYYNLLYIICIRIIWFLFIWRRSTSMLKFLFLKL